MEATASTERTTGNGTSRELTQLDLAELELDPIVNRAVDDKWVDHLARQFNPLFLGVFHIARQDDGTYKVIDGQHRKLAAEKVGYDEPVACWVYPGMSREQQANLFLEVNMQRNVHAIDRFKKAVVAGRPNEVAVAKVLADYDLEVGHGAEQVGSPGALLQAHRAKGGDELLRQIVATLTGAWPEAGAGALQGELVAVALQLARKYRSELDFERLQEALAQTTPIALLGDAKVKHDSAPRFTRRWFVAAAVVDLYNGVSRSKRLAVWGRVA